MANRFEESAQRIIDRNFGSLQKALIITQTDGFDYQSQSDRNPIVTETTALKRKLTKSEFERSNVQLGDFALIFTNPVQINVDSDEVTFDGVVLDLVTVISLAGEAAQTLIARIK